MLDHPVQQRPIGVSSSEADCDRVDVWVVADELAAFGAEPSPGSWPAGQIIDQDAPQVRTLLLVVSGAIFVALKEGCKRTDLTSTHAHRRAGPSVWH